MLHVWVHNVQKVTLLTSVEPRVNQTWEPISVRTEWLFGRSLPVRRCAVAFLDQSAGFCIYLVRVNPSADLSLTCCFWRQTAFIHWCSQLRLAEAKVKETQALLSNCHSRDEAKDDRYPRFHHPAGAGWPAWSRPGGFAMMRGRWENTRLLQGKASHLFSHLSKPEVYDTLPLATGFWEQQCVMWGQSEENTLL